MVSRLVEVNLVKISCEIDSEIIFWYLNVPLYLCMYFEINTLGCQTQIIVLIIGSLAHVP